MNQSLTLFIKIKNFCISIIKKIQSFIIMYVKYLINIKKLYIMIEFIFPFF